MLRAMRGAGRRNGVLGALIPPLALLACGGQTRSGGVVDASGSDGKGPSQDAGVSIDAGRQTPGIADAHTGPRTETGDASLNGDAARDASGGDASRRDAADHVDAAPLVDAGPRGVVLAGAYLDGDFLDVFFDGWAAAPDSLEFFVDVDGVTDGGQRVFKHGVVLERVDFGYRLLTFVDGWHGITFDPCTYVAVDGSTGTLRIRVPRPYVDRGGSLEVSMDFRDGSPALAPSVGELPDFAGAPLCTAGETGDVVVVPGRYTTSWVAEGFNATTRLCALDDGGSPACWDESLSSIAAALPRGPFTALGPRASDLCGLEAGGTLSCWPIAGLDLAVSPHLLAGPYTAVSTIADCGIIDSGDIICEADTTPDAGPTRHPGPYLDVSGGGRRGCGVLADGSLDCWGFSADAEDPPVPLAQLAGPYRAVAVAGSGAEVAALRLDGRVDFAVAGQQRLLRLAGNRYQRLSTSYSICAIDSDGLATCLGSVPDVPSLRFRDVHVGEFTYPHCGVLLDGRLVCF